MNNNNSALGKHVAPFSKSGFFSPSTVSAGLSRFHASASGLKGPAIAAFNSSHAGHCPFGSTPLPTESAGWAQFVHLGTTRIWKADGTINEARWQTFVDAVTKGQAPQEKQVVIKRVLMRYLQDSLQHDPQESDTARHATNSLFSYTQATAASQAWEEVYNLLTCGWKHNEQTNENEPYIDLELIRLFFENSEEAFKQAETLKLPIAKPMAEARSASRVHCF